MALNITTVNKSCKEKTDKKAFMENLWSNFYGVLQNLQKNMVTPLTEKQCLFLK